ncbi:MAG: type III pantothenate kinase [Candidatus Moduliflexus flocculans]|nr:type III pantothenate kinase [Candidatus Moduliflexus flocculans]
MPGTGRSGWAWAIPGRPGSVGGPGSASEPIPFRSAEEYAWTLAGLCARHGCGSRRAADRVILSSVVPSLTPAAQVRLRPGLRARRARRRPAGSLTVGPGIRTGMKIRTDIPGEVGSDLVCDAVGAYARLGTACIVVDFEALLTFTAVNGEGELLGVAIAPGPQAAAESLRANGAQLPQVRLEPPARAIREELRPVHPVRDPAGIFGPRGPDGGPVPQGAGLSRGCGGHGGRDRPCFGSPRGDARSSILGCPWRGWPFWMKGIG